jgi:hypothetical protein
MTNDLPQQATPIIIKGGTRGVIAAKAIEIEANGLFLIIEQFQSSPNEWTQSNSEFNVSYIESVVVGDMGNDQQFCQTSTMAHPLTYAFNDTDGSTIFTVREVAAAKGFMLQITVDSTDDYFQVDSQSVTPPDTWSTSTFNTTDAEVYSIEVADANNVPVCRLLRANGENIYLNLEPA